MARPIGRDTQSMEPRGGHRLRAHGETVSGKSPREPTPRQGGGEAETQRSARPLGDQNAPSHPRGHDPARLTAGEADQLAKCRPGRARGYRAPRGKRCCPVWSGSCGSRPGAGRSSLRIRRARRASRPETTGSSGNGELDGPYGERRALLGAHLEAADDRFVDVGDRFLLAPTLTHAARDRGAFGDHHPGLVALERHGQPHVHPVAAPGGAACSDWWRRRESKRFGALRQPTRANKRQQFRTRWRRPGRAEQARTESACYKFVTAPHRARRREEGSRSQRELRG